MNRPSSKLQQNQLQEQTGQLEQATEQDTAIEFNTAEDAIRFDIEQTNVPPAIGERLQESVRQETGPPPPSGWRRWFGCQRKE